LAGSEAFWGTHRFLDNHRNDAYGQIHENTSIPPLTHSTVIPCAGEDREHHSQHYSNSQDRSSDDRHRRLYDFRTWQLSLEYDSGGRAEVMDKDDLEDWW